MKNSLKSIALLLMLVAAGYLTGSALAESNNIDSFNCAFSYCDVHEGKCKPNENMTKCMGPGGQEPCTQSLPCISPGEG